MTQTPKAYCRLVQRHLSCPDEITLGKRCSAAAISAVPLASSQLVCAGHVPASLAGADHPLRTTWPATRLRGFSRSLSSNDTE